MNGAVVAPSVNTQPTGTTPQGQTPQGQAPQVQTPQPKPATQPTPPVTQPKPVQQPTPPSEPKATGGAHSPISGTSLADLLKATTSKSTEEGAEQVAINPLTDIDPLTEQKITNVRERFIAKLREKSMRMALAFETMKVDSNRLSVEVESDVLEDEILHHKNEVMQLLKDTAAVTGTLELELVRPEVEYQAPKPIRVEDRMAYLVEKNPVVAKLRKALELELE